LEHNNTNFDFLELDTCHLFQNLWYYIMCCNLMGDPSMTLCTGILDVTLVPILQPTTEVKL